MTDSCALAQARLAEAVDGLRTATPREKIVSAVKASFLGSVVTPMKMAGGNALSLGMRTLAVHPAEAAFDYLRAVGQSVKEGKLSLTPDEFRTVKLSLDSEGLGQMWRAFKKGTEPTTGAMREARRAYVATDGPWKAVREAVSTFANELNTRLNAEHIYRIQDYQGNTHYNHPLSDAAVNGIFGVAEALDRPFWRAAHDFSMHVQSKTMAASEGLTGDALKQRAAELFDHPTDEMALRAVDHANYTTFKNKTVLGNAAQDLKTGLARRADQPVPQDLSPWSTKKAEARKTAHAVGSVATELTLPFTGVPSSVAGQSFSLATGPLSLVRLISTANRSPARAATIIAESGVGTSMIAAGYKLAHDGHLVGAAPTNPTERAQFDAEGKQPYSVKIGGKWFDLRFTMPVGAPLFAGAALYESKGKTPEEKAIAGVGATSKMLTNQTYLQNLDNLVQALQAPEQRGQRLVSSMVPLPAVLGQVARATDATERNPKTITDMLKARIPGLSHTVVPKVDALGRVQKRTGLERLSEVISPSRIKEPSETSVTQAFRSAGVSLSKPSSSSTVGGQKVERTPEQQVGYEQTVGTDLDKYLTQVIATPEYQAVPDAMKGKVLTRIRDAFHEKYGAVDAARRLQGMTP